MTILLLAILILKNPAIKESITLQKQKQQKLHYVKYIFKVKQTRGSVGLACVAHLSFSFEET
jgi:hypothetical protein